MSIIAFSITQANRLSERFRKLKFMNTGPSGSKEPLIPKAKKKFLQFIPQQPRQPRFAYFTLVELCLIEQGLGAAVANGDNMTVFIQPMLNEIRDAKAEIKQEIKEKMS